MYLEHNPRVEVWTERKAACQPADQRVLVVDDYIDTADALCMSLLVHGYDARSAYGGCDALQIAAAWRPHTIILDIAMPDLSGLAVATSLRRMSELSSTVLIAYTGEPSNDGYVEVQRCGFDAICAKPASPVWLLRLLEKMTAAPAQG